MANQNLSQFTEKLFVTDADHTFIWDTAASISKRVSRNSWLNSGTLTSDAPVTISQTWNAVGQTFTAFKVNAAGTSGTNSAAASLLADLQLNGVSKLSVDKSGIITLPQTGGDASALICGGSAITNAATYIGIYGIRLDSTSSINWAPGKNLNVLDTILLRDGAANTLAMRNGALPQTFRVYNTYSNAGVDVEYLQLSTSASGFRVGTNSSGSGSSRPLFLGVGGGSQWQINTSGHIGTFGSDNLYDIGASGANRPRNLYVGSNIYAAGNVGIGTTAPTANFEVVGGLTNTVIIGNQTNNGTSASLTFRGKTGGGINLSAVWMMRADANFQLDTYASTAAIRVDASTGKVAFANGIEGETFLTGRIAIGAAISADENEGLLVVKKGYNNATGNHHCIRVTAVDSVLASAAGINFFDSQGTVSSANNIDHIADFQARSVRTGTGTMNDWHGFYTAPVISSTGTTTRVAHFEVTNAGGTGAIGTQYGIKIASLTRGSTANYAVFTAGTTPSLFGGDVEVGTSANGIILKSPDGTRYRITVPNGGASLTITAV